MHSLIVNLNLVIHWLASTVLNCSKQTIFKTIKSIQNSLISSIFTSSYELQIDEKYQNKGLGEHFMKCLEKLAKKWQMERIVLTVLTNNDGALRFYKRLGYTVDETSPDDEPSYQIFSKEV